MAILATSVNDARLNCPAYSFDEHTGLLYARLGVAGSAPNNGYGWSEERYDGVCACFRISGNYTQLGVMHYPAMNVTLPAEFSAIGTQIRAQYGSNTALVVTDSMFNRAGIWENRLNRNIGTFTNLDIVATYAHSPFASGIVNSPRIIRRAL